MLVLGIETSCDETGVAVYDSKKGLLSNELYSQIKLHQEHGGVVPELASRDHVKRLSPLLEQALKNGKGITWLDDLRIPFAGADDLETWDYNRRGGTERTPDIDVGTTMSDVGGNPEHKWGYKKQKSIAKLKKSDYEK